MCRLSSEWGSFRSLWWSSPRHSQRAPEKSLRQLAAPLVAATLVAMAAVAVHTSQVPLIAVIVTLLVLERALRQRSFGVVKRSLVRALLCGAGAIILFAPNATHLVSGVSERSSVTLTRPISFGHTLKNLVTLHIPTGGFEQVLLALLTAVGVVIFIARREFAWVLSYLFVSR